MIEFKCYFAARQNVGYFIVFMKYSTFLFCNYVAIMVQSQTGNTKKENPNGRYGIPRRKGENAMPKRTYTVSTRLSIHSPLVVYMKDYMEDYNKIYRYAWQIYFTV